MGRNRLSPDDRIKTELTKIGNLLAEEEHEKIIKYLKTIRSKTLRSLCSFSWARMENHNLLLNDKKVLAKAFNMGERKVYDLVKTICFINAVADQSFRKMQLDFSKLMLEIPKQTTPTNSTQTNPTKPNTNKE